MRLHIHYSRVSGSEPVIQAFRKFLEETDINNEARFKEIDETPELKLDKIRQRHQLLPGAPAIVYIENTESKGNEGPRHIAIFYDSTPKSEPPKTEIEKLLVVVFRNTGDEPIIGSSTINKWSTIMPDDIRHANRGDFVKNLVAATAEGKSSL